jgi:hypothetical protein
MAERVLRGSRLGAVSYETDRDNDLAPRQQARYRTPSGAEYAISFASDAEIPPVWQCRNGEEGVLVDGAAAHEAKAVKPARTHWDMLIERRTEEELEALLAERLDVLRRRRGGS